MFYGKTSGFSRCFFLKYNGETVIISSGSGDAIITQLYKNNIPNEKIYVPDITVIKEDDIEFIEANYDYFNLLYNELADQKSKDVLAGILNYRLIHDLLYVQRIADKSGDQYFDNELIQYTSDDILLDCGAYIGDTIESYCMHNKGVYKKVICLEPNPYNCKIIQKMDNEYRIELYNVAAYHKEKELVLAAEQL